MVLASFLSRGCGIPNTATAPRVAIDVAVPDNNLCFDTAALYAPAGSLVAITLPNRADIPATQHNWMVLETGTEDAVAAAGAMAGAKRAWVAHGDSRGWPVQAPPPGT